MKKFILFLIGIMIIPIIVSAQRSISCESPYLPDPTWKVLDNQKEIVKFDPANLKLMPLVNKIEFYDFKQTGLSACVLDFLLDHQELIPKEWQGKTIIFTGTLYQDAGGIKVYRNLTYWDGNWDWNRSYLDDSSKVNHAVVLKQ